MSGFSWYCNIDGQRCGPFSKAELYRLAQDGRLTQRDPVWEEGKPIAVEAGSIPGVFTIAQHLRLDDPGPFLKVGERFRSGGAVWHGNVVASRHAVYLLKERKRHYEFGQRLPARLIEAAINTTDDIRTCAAAELPERLREQLDPGLRHPSYDVIVLLKDTVELVTTSLLHDSITFHADGDRFKVAISLFEMFRVPRELERLGWQLDRPRAAKSASPHDQRSTEDKRVHTGNPTLTERIGYLLAALVIIAAIVAVRAFIRAFSR